MRAEFLVVCLTAGAIVPAAVVSAQPAPPARPEISAPIVSQEVRPIRFTANVRTLPLVRALSADAPVRDVADMRQRGAAPEAPPSGRGNGIPPYAGDAVAATATPVSFDGIPATGWTPPDTVGDVGPNHYVQMVNISFAIYDKSGSLLAGPSPINALWAGSGGACEADNNGDPIVRYDAMADRWMLSQFSLSVGAECIAISQTSDPVAGGWFLYEFPTPGFPDYPKIGVWPDGYYMGTQRGFPGGGLDVYAFDRVKMLAGLPAGSIHFTVGAPSLFLQPSDLDGPAPPAGTPNIFVRHVDGNQFGGADRLELFAFRANWFTPALSTFTALATLPVAPFNAIICGSNFFGTCVPQPGTVQRLETLPAWLMWRLQYRNFGTHETLVTNHTVNADNADHAGIRWYELRRVGAGAWTLFQEGTHAPDAGAPGMADDPHRWMGSIAMNGKGSVALGYSASSATVSPGLRYASRDVGDAAGQLPAPEVTLVAGAGSQTGSIRWGNYSTMDVDPLDDCTFWYTSEYYTATSPNGWRTRISSFTLPSCTTPPPPPPAPPVIRHHAALFTGGLFAEGTQPLESGLDIGFRYRRHRLLPAWSVEFETGVTSAGNAIEDGILVRGQVHALFHPIPPASSVQPFLLGGLGIAHHNGLTTSDTGPLVTLGGGADFDWTPRVGFRLDGRVLWMHDVLAPGWQTSGQVLFGVTFRF